jgi:hypothetical protein
VSHGRSAGRDDQRDHALIGQVVDLLSAALADPDRLHDIGQQAALLWWSLDSEAPRAGDPTEVEAALLDLAMWHIRDDRLGRQRGTPSDFDAHRERLRHLMLDSSPDE